MYALHQAWTIKQFQPYLLPGTIKKKKKTEKCYKDTIIYYRQYSQYLRTQMVHSGENDHVIDIISSYRLALLYIVLKFNLP